MPLGQCRFFLFVALVGAALVACSAGGEGPPVGSGGAPGSGGASASGGSNGSGGKAASGGTPGSGGLVGSGGTASGGASSGGSVGSGGVMASGGVSSGGALGSGGQTASGGSTGGRGGPRGGVTGTAGAGDSAGKGGGGAGARGGGSGAGATGSGGAGSGGNGGEGAIVKSGGCGKTPTLKNGTITINSGGNRQYIIDIPTNYDNTHPYRLVFGIHWVGGTMTDVATGQTVTRNVWSYYGLKQLANNSTIFVAPQGISNGWSNSGGADVTFFTNMVKQIEDDLCVDTSRIFAIGFSFGGAMSYSLACSLPDTFRAVTVQDGGMLSGCSGGTKPIAYLGVHGVVDGTLNISGGRQMRDKFVMNNGCTKPATVSETTSGSKSHVCYKYEGCSAGHPVEWCTFDGDHKAAPADGACQTCDDGNKTWVPGEAWKFFTQF